MKAYMVIAQREGGLFTGAEDGLVQFPGQPRLAEYKVSVSGNMHYDGTTANAGTTPLVNALGSVTA